MPRHRALGDLGGALADQESGIDKPCGAPGPATAPATERATGPQRSTSQLTAQAATIGLLQRLVDRLVRDVHLRPVRELLTQHAADLLGAPPPVEPLLHQLTQLGIAP